MTVTPPAEWTRPAQLPPDGLHVWRIVLSGRTAPGEPVTLPGDEAVRARRLVDPKARSRFLALRHATRAILARYVRSTPAALRFAREARGKPILVEPRTDWAFNLTDSRDLALLAVSRIGAVGIDLEHLRAVARRDGIARRMFGEDMVAELARSPAAERDTVFFRRWTAFEALQKATGAGLAGPRADPDDWRVRHFVPAPGCLAALAHRAALDPEIHYFSFPD